MIGVEILFVMNTVNTPERIWDKFINDQFLTTIIKEAKELDVAGTVAPNFLEINR
ncbi:6537_t:CDS:1, partial [Dentiscutata erythropus]